LRIDWRGIVPALSTPVDENGALDEESLRSEVRWNIEKGAHLLAVSLMAGEFEKYTDAERIRCFEITVDEASGKVPVLAGVSHSGTDPAVYLAKRARDIGADGIVVLPPYFNNEKASLSLYDHFSTIASRVDLPVMIQDCEGVGPYICPSLYAKLAEDFDNMVSVKIEGIRAWEKMLETRRILGDELAIFGGMAARNILQELRIGISGNIPDACLTDVLVDVYESFAAGDVKKAEDTFRRYSLWLDFLNLHRLSNIEVEKETLRLRGVIRSSFTRLPRGPLLDEETGAELKQILQNMSLI